MASLLLDDDVTLATLLLLSGGDKDCEYTYSKKYILANPRVNINESVVNINVFFILWSGLFCIF